MAELAQKAAVPVGQGGKSCGPLPDSCSATNVGVAPSACHCRRSFDKRPVFLFTNQREAA